MDPDQGASAEISGSQGVQAGDGNVQYNQSGETNVVAGHDAFVAGRDVHAYLVMQPGPLVPERIVVGNVPQEPPAFQVRQDGLSALRDAGPGVCVVRSVTGMRGVGKSQVAAAYARECIDDGWRLVAWIDAEDTARALGGLAEIAARFGIGQDGASLEDTGKLVRSRLEADGDRCLVVLDNLHSLAPFLAYIPAAGKSRVVITSTRKLPLGSVVAVEVFTEEEALKFLAARTGCDDGEGAAELSRELGYLPLALAQAAAVIAAQRLTYPVYLQRLRDFPLAGYLVPDDDDPYPHGLAEAVMLSLNAVAADVQARLCQDLLDLIAMLSPAGVSRALLQTVGSAGALSGAGVLPRHGKTKKAGKALQAEAIDKALGTLASASLLAFSADGSTVAAHRLVMRVVRERHAGDARTAVIARACALLEAVALPLGEPWQERQAARDIVSHITALTENAGPALRDDDPVTTELLVLRGMALAYLSLLGNDPAQTSELGAVLLADCKRVLGSTHLHTLAVRDSVGLAYTAAGRHDDAIRLYRLNLAAYERTAGDTDPRTFTLMGRKLTLTGRSLTVMIRNLTLMTRNNLASAYQSAGRADAAIPLLEDTLAYCEHTLGSTQEITLSLRTNLATAYQETGRHDEAIALHQQTLTDRERTLDSSHPKILLTRNNLSNSYLAAGRLDEAIALHEQNLSDLEHTLGPDHPDTVGSRNSLAYTYLSSGRIREAIPMFEQALSECERVHGPHHPETLRVRSNLASARQQAVPQSGDTPT